MRVVTMFILEADDGHEFHAPVAGVVLSVNGEYQVVRQSIAIDDDSAEDGEVRNLFEDHLRRMDEAHARNTCIAGGCVEDLLVDERRQIDMAKCRQTACMMKPGHDGDHFSILGSFKAAANE